MKIFLILGGVLIVVLLGVVLYPISNPSVVPPAPTPISPVAPQSVSPSAYTPPDNGKVQPVLPLSKQADFIIDITTVGFSPDKITIKVGDSIIWTNRDRAPHQLSSSAENTYSSNGPTTTANSCGELKLGDSCKITFTAAGTWKYYDKLNTKFVGSVTVQ